MQPAPRRRDALFGVERRRAADDHHVQLVSEEAIEVVVCRGSDIGGQRRGAAGVRAAHRLDRQSVNRLDRPGVGLADAAAADDADSHGVIRTR